MATRTRKKKIDLTQIYPKNFTSNGLFYAELPLSDLVIDTAYQTPNRQRRNSGLMNNFDVRQANCILTSYRDGKLYVINGWHRNLAAQAAGYTHLAGIVLSGLTQKEEALLFSTQELLTNKISQIERYDSEMVAKLSATLTIDNICATLGYSIAHYGRPESTYIAAINAVRRIFHKNGPECLAWILTFVKKLTWYGKPGCVDNSMLRAFEAVYESSTDNNTLPEAEQNMFDALHRLSPKYVTAFTKAYMPTDDKRTATKAVFQLIADGRLTKDEMLTFLPENQVRGA